MKGILGFTLCAGISCTELNGPEYKVGPLGEGGVMRIGYLQRRGSTLSPLGALYLEEVRRAMDAAPGNVLFAGFVGAEELCAAYCWADAFAFLSPAETAGIVVLESLACGIPPIVRDIPAYADWRAARKTG